MNPPCYNRETHTDCPKRRVGCRSTCEEWEKYETAKKEEYAQRQSEVETNYRPLNLKRRRALQKLLNRNKR